jgi:hypothetical protein
VTLQAIMGALIRFQLERWLQRGPLYQLLFAAALVLVVSLLGGVAAWVFSDQFDSLPGAIWWSFLRLTDPGYLGDDEGVALRIISTTVTVLGYVLFMGSLIAILTQWLRDTLKRFEEGLSSISMKGHVVILGWTNRTPEIVLQLLSARGRLKRFLEEQGQRRLRIVVVADHVDEARRQRLRNFIGGHARNGQVFLRRGSATVSLDLERFDLGRSAVVVIPGDAFAYGGAEASDARVFRSLLNLRSALATVPEASRPAVVAEVIDADKDATAHQAYGGELEVVIGDEMIARLMARYVIDPRRFSVCIELLTHNEGCTPFVRPMPEYTGQHPFSIPTRRDRAIVLGAVRRVAGEWKAFPAPDPDFTLQPEDRVFYLARAFDDFERSENGDEPRRDTPVSSTSPVVALARRVLVIGWSATVARAVEDLLTAPEMQLQLTVLSRMPLEERGSWFQGETLATSRLDVNHLEADALARGVVDSLDLGAFHTVLVAASALQEGAEESDARSLTLYELLRGERREQCANAEQRPSILVELAHPASAEHALEPDDQLVLRPRLLGYLQSHVALRPALNAVYEALFLPQSGAQILVRDGSGQDCPDYRALVAAEARPGDIPLGILLDAGTPTESVVLCPADAYHWRGTAELVVLARLETAAFHEN